MKTRELVRLLQEADPSGEAEANVDGCDIYQVYLEDGYYDGPYEVLIHDDNLKPYWTIVGGQFRRDGKKVKIVTVSIHDAICEWVLAGKDPEDFKLEAIAPGVYDYDAIFAKMREDAKDFGKE